MGGCGSPVDCTLPEGEQTPAHTCTMEGGASQIFVAVSHTAEVPQLMEGCWATNGFEGNFPGNCSFQNHLKLKHGAFEKHQLQEILYNTKRLHV